MSDRLSSARNVQPLRNVLQQVSPYEAEIISARDIPDFGNDENFAVVMIKIGNQYFADSIICLGDAPKPGEYWRFYASASFPMARKIADEAPVQEEPKVEEAPAESEATE